jgi:hypothetical protein
VIRSFGRIATVVAICLSIGLQWLALQSIAWTTMLINKAKCAPFRTAIAHTFDGAHPCSLCHAVNKGKASETKSDFQPATPKFDLICFTRAVQSAPPFAPFDYGRHVFSAVELRDSPPVPPPRLG